MGPDPQTPKLAFFPKKVGFRFLGLNCRFRGFGGLGPQFRGFGVRDPSFGVPGSGVPFPGFGVPNPSSGVSWVLGSGTPKLGFGDRDLSSRIPENLDVQILEIHMLISISEKIQSLTFPETKCFMYLPITQKNTSPQPCACATDNIAFIFYIYIYYSLNSHHSRFSRLFDSP